MDKNFLENNNINNEKEKERESYILHQTSEDVISEYEGLTNNNNKEILSQKNSFQERFSEKLSIISNALKTEKKGMLYCLLAHFLWTTNSIYLKFLTQYFQSKFKNKTFLFSRGLMTLIISYFLGIYQEGKILKLNESGKYFFLNYQIDSFCINYKIFISY